jgi:hypothetical protein
MENIKTDNLHYLKELTNLRLLAVELLPDKRIRVALTATESDGMRVVPPLRRDEAYGMQEVQDRSYGVANGQT